jgi:hypothetical protein
VRPERPAERRQSDLGCGQLAHHSGAEPIHVSRCVRKSSKPTSITLHAAWEGTAGGVCRALGARPGGPFPSSASSRQAYMVYDMVLPKGR